MPELTAKRSLNENILKTIRELFDACGAQSFSEILYEVRTQCVGVDSLEEAHKQVKVHLAYLISLGSVCESKDEFGIVYGHPWDL